MIGEGAQILTQFDRTDWGALARDMSVICEHAKALQSRFLAQAGHTWQSARALNQTGRDALQAEYTRWLAAEGDA